MDVMKTRLQLDRSGRYTGKLPPPSSPPPPFPFPTPVGLTLTHAPHLHVR